MLFVRRLLRQWVQWKQWCGSRNTGIRQMGCFPKVNKDYLTIMTSYSDKLYRTFENGVCCNMNMPLFVIAQVSSISASGRRHWISAVLLWQPYWLVTKVAPTVEYIGSYWIIACGVAILLASHQMLPLAVKNKSDWIWISILLWETHWLLASR